MQRAKGEIGRRQFIETGLLVGAAGSSVSAKPARAASQATAFKKKRIALVGTGHRGTSTWGRKLIHPFKDYVEMVGLCDINPKRVREAQKQIGAEAPCQLLLDTESRTGVKLTTTFNARFGGASEEIKKNPETLCA